MKENISKDNVITYDTIGEETIDNNASNKKNNINEGIFGRNISSEEDETEKLNKEGETSDNNITQKIKYYSSNIGSYLISITNKIDIEPSFKLFSFNLCAGILFILFTFFSFPFLLLSPTKFLLTFSIGNILIIISFLFYYGSKEYFSIIFNSSRIWISILYLVSIIVGLALSVKQKYFLTLIFAGFQIVAVILFVLSFIPGGRSGIEFFKSFFISTFFSVFENVKNKLIKNGNNYNLPN